MKLRPLPTLPDTRFAVVIAADAVPC